MAFQLPVKLIEFLAPRIIEHARKTPYSHLQGYMQRFWLIRPPRRRVLRFSARVHHILRSDLDRDVLHDHPAPSISVIMLRSYKEIMPRDQRQHPANDVGDGLVEKWRKPGAIIFRRARSRHRLVLPEGTTVWTIFIFLGDKTQAWGFYTPAGWVWWREFLNEWEGLTEEEIRRAEHRLGHPPNIPPGVIVHPDDVPWRLAA